MLLGLPFFKRPDPPAARPTDDATARSIVTGYVSILRAKVEARRNILLAQAEGTDSRSEAEALAIRVDECNITLGMLGDSA